ncbi:eukaryotic translation initiation factor 3 subunit A [Kwoniella shandongensis]|uniref:Eukaryotic translation initiation factor 3 subunit A n=1 Tax=Kwoniella shandongensis TaxID=1734106 RepID=A0A5M6C1C1_9TREE|nr:eukaryotic translation initiation factor 3 subunit A [Kwoniella shandongensis]KAA5527009.1 eukaryotic translation initiation factor 3 subunit A [Kwoniella shandongensis]
MPPIYVKPENALKRSEELLALGTPQSQQQAFENLVEVFQSKRFKHTPINVLEPIAIKFIDLCVLLNRKAHARAALVVYKNAAQTTSVASIEKVLNHFIAQAEERLSVASEQAKTEVAALADAPVVDDDLPLQPASILLDTFVDSAGDRERIERRLIAPAQKFCWDAYDISLDIAKSNDRLEIIYQSIAHRAFNFCKVHQRKTDFRRLCEQRLRKDLANAAKYGHQQHAINLSDPETLSRFLDTRFLQLETAVELELWQEAFRSVEDVHGLVAGRKHTKPAMMANYYEKLTQIFKAEGGKQTAVFHAAAWARYFQHAERAGIVNDKASGCVLLSALAVPLGEVESKQRLVALLNLPKMPTREALVHDAAAKHLKRVPADLRQIYHILEADFQPTTACKVLAPLITSLSADYQPYLPALREVVLSRLVQELAQVYDTVTLSHILNLVKPFDNTPWATDMSSLEKFLMTACQRGDINASVDHVAQTITFVSNTAEPNRLSNLAICLYNTIQYLNPAPVASRADAFAAAIAQAEEERKAVAHRRQIVTKRRELMEEANLRRQKEESTALAEKLKAKAEEDARRAKEAAKQAEIDRVRKQINETKEAEAKQLAASLAAKGALKVDISNIQDLDSSKLVAMQVEQLAKEKKEFAERLRIVGKRVDHLERAFRKEERPLLVQDYERQKTEDKVTHERSNVQAREQAIAHQKAVLEMKNRLGRMMPDYLSAREKVQSQREEEFRLSREKARRKIEEEKEKLKAAVIERRKKDKERRDREEAEALEREQQEREEAEQRAAEEAAREEEEARAAAEIEARKAEAAERARKLKEERDAERAKLDEIARKQREREEEAERRRLERSSGTGAYRRPEPAAAAAAGSPGAGTPPAIAPTVVKAGGWRERAAAKAAGGAGESPSSTPAPSSPAPARASPQSPAATPAAAPPNGEAVPERGGVYRRGMGVRGGRGGGANTPPSTRGGATGGSRW